MSEHAIWEYLKTLETGEGGGGGAVSGVKGDAEASYRTGNVNLTPANIGATPLLAGAIQMFAGTTAPSGWLLCDGRAISRTDFATLFAVIGTTYGAGDGSTTFNIPDFRGRVGVGVGTGTATGATAHTLNQKAGNENAIVPYHRHSVDSVSIASSGAHGHTANSRSVYNGSSNYAAITGTGGTSTTTGAIVSSGAHTHSVPAHNTDYVGTSGNTTGANMMPYIGINYIICTGN